MLLVSVFTVSYLERGTGRHAQDPVSEKLYPGCSEAERDCNRGVRNLLGPVVQHPIWSMFFGYTCTYIHISTTRVSSIAAFSPPCHHLPPTSPSRDMASTGEKSPEAKIHLRITLMTQIPITGCLCACISLRNFPVPSADKSRMRVQTVKKHARNATTPDPACVVSSMALLRNALIRNARKGKRESSGGLTRSVTEGCVDILYHFK